MSWTLYHAQPQPPPSAILLASPALSHLLLRAGVLPRTHGSALFTRGETQALAVATLGTARAALRSDNLSDEDDRHFYLQYFFPPSSVGEVRGAITVMYGS